MTTPTPIPELFIERIRSLLGDEADEFLKAIEQPSKTSIRFNPLRKVEGLFSESKQIPWCETGRILAERPSFIADPLFHAGAYYVQEASSMFLHQALNQVIPWLPENPLVLDLCAAPGGKSTLISSVLNGKGLLVSNEVIRSRVTVLMENLDKWGFANKVVTNNDPKDFAKLGERFDLIVTDAPCSGEGMFRRDAHAIKEWNPELVQLCASRQQRILDEAVACLKPGGFLIYSTCTFNHEENEAQVARLTREYDMIPISLAPVDEAGVVVHEYEGTSMEAVRFYFHRTSGEGLFMACLKKPGTLADSEYKKVRSEIFPKADQWLDGSQPWAFITHKEILHAIPLEAFPAVEWLRHQLQVVDFGISMGTIKKQDLIPEHALALSHALSKQVPRAELDLKQARKYLMRDAPDRHAFETEGWQVVTYQGLSLGWVKVLQNRVNNYFPTHLRVLKNIADENS